MKITLNLKFKSDEAIDAVNRSAKQIKLLRKWVAISANQHIADKKSVLNRVRWFHPDHRYDQKTRGLIFDEKSHLHMLWELWEKDDFSSQSAAMPLKILLLHDKEFESWTDFGPVDFRHQAMITAAQLSLYEADFLAMEVQKEQKNEAQIWRRLYWFSRFYNVWVWISLSYTPPQWETAYEKSSLALAWKREAWKYRKNKLGSSGVKPPSDRTIASNFVKLHRSHSLTVGTVQDYFSERTKSLGKTSKDKLI
jgi:hypothetical protein